jgi:secreted trypsin-like serine protease
MGVAVLLASGVALAITGGTADVKDPVTGQFKYPYVGALLWPEGFPDDTYTYCTGTLISPTVFLTAAHCDAWTGDAVTFDAKYDPNSSTSYSICLPEECTDAFDGTFYVGPKGTDIAVVKFNEAIPDIDPTKLPNLPTRHLLDSLNLVKGVSPFTAVGYGSSLGDKQPGGPWERLTYSDQRSWAVTKFNTLGRTYLRLTQKDGAGTCDGDSGGPNFVGTYPYPNNVPTIASITITGDSWCQTTNVTLRLDIAATRDFLRPYGVLPDPNAQ